MSALKFGLSDAQVIRAIQRLEGYEFNIRDLYRYAVGGLAVPSVTWRRQSGIPRRYSLGDLHRLRLIARLRKAGVSLQRVRLVLAYVEAQLEDALQPRTKAVLVVRRHHAEIVRDGAPAVRVPSGQLALPLAEVVTPEAEVRKVIAA